MLFYFTCPMAVTQPCNYHFCHLYTVCDFILCAAWTQKRYHDYGVCTVNYASVWRWDSIIISVLCWNSEMHVQNFPWLRGAQVFCFLGNCYSQLPNQEKKNSSDFVSSKELLEIPWVKVEAEHLAH